MRSILRIALVVLALFALAAAAFAQGRGRGVGQGRRVDIFSNGHDARNGRIGRNQDWKCSVFVNCHDARDGRLDGRGPRISRVNQNFVSRGDRVGYRNRYSTNDYWRRRHVTYINGWHYRNRTWRDR